NLFNEAEDIESIKLIIEKLGKSIQQKIITKDFLNQNKERVVKVLSGLPSETQKSLEKLKIKLGLSIEISKEISKNEKPLQYHPPLVNVLTSAPQKTEKLEVKNFVTHFRNRFLKMKEFLQNHSKLENVISINKISGNRQGVSVIGFVSDKRITKNKNMILELEDLTGRIRVLINKDKSEIYDLAEEISLDSIIGVRGSGNREIMFANEIVFPEARLFERKKSPYDENVLFIGDFHFGSKRFLEENFLRFVDYLNGKTGDPEAEKIKYLYIVGDLVAGIGNYPNQEKDLSILNLEEQFCRLVELLGKIRRDIKIIISPGNHDGVRLMEPQPVFDEKFAWALHDMKNVILTGNPCYTNIGAGKNFSGFDVLTYHGFSFFYYTDNIPSLIKNKAAHNPEFVMKYILKNRHLAPTHASTQYYPSEEDELLIKKIPDIFVTGHLHKSAVSYYNNILLVSVSTWETLTDYMEKVGSKPDFCKVPMFNLKTRTVKILDFEEEENQSN
ncbi:MAG: metallophosphoesterase, partial [Nanoarchaeota archaeon]|nr:metallophosphoesterase [Nanoarchaeota archaeon]